MKHWLIAALAAFALNGQAYSETGLASFYDGPVHHGHRMANGGIYDQESDTCAHKTYPFDTQLRVARGGGHSVVCVVRDRGPFVQGRIIDMSRKHARELGMFDPGVVPVTVEQVP